MRLFGIAFAVDHIPHNRAIMGMRYATEMGAFFFQLYDGGVDRYGAFYVCQKLGRKQKQTEPGKYHPGNRKEYVTHGEPLKNWRE